MKRYIYLLCMLVVIFCSCKSNKNSIPTVLERRKLMDSTCCNESFLEITKFDSLPSFQYRGIKRNIPPYKQGKKRENMFGRDSLLSVYLEDKILRPVECEGLFSYTICLTIDESGTVKAVQFVDDRHQIIELNNSIKNEINKIRFIPAQKNGKNKSIKVCVNILLDLYNNQSEISKCIFRK